MSYRKFILNAHLLAGLCAALFLILLGVTGSFMVFENEIDRALNAKLTWVHPGDKRLSLSEMKGKLEGTYASYRLAGLAIPARSDMAWDAFLQSQKLRKGIGVAFDPYTGRILGTDADRNNFVNSVHQFHTHLLMRNTGAAIVTWAAVFLLFLSITGLVLWWPRKVLRVNWRSPAKKLNFDLHQTIGIYFSVFLFLFALTGIVIHWDAAATAVANRLTGSPEAPTFPRQRPPSSMAVALDPDRLLTIAQSTVPGARVTSIELIGNPIRVAMKYPEDSTPAGRTNLFIDPYSGKSVFLLSSRTGPLGFRIIKLWNREIHTGDILGMPTRILACLLSLALPVMAITGPLIWWNRRARKPVAKRATELNNAA